MAGGQRRLLAAAALGFASALFLVLRRALRKRLQPESTRAGLAAVEAERAQDNAGEEDASRETSTFASRVASFTLDASTPDSDDDEMPPLELDDSDSGHAHVVDDDHCHSLLQHLPTDVGALILQFASTCDIRRLACAAKQVGTFGTRSNKTQPQNSGSGTFHKTHPKTTLTICSISFFRRTCSSRPRCTCERP